MMRWIAIIGFFSAVGCTTQLGVFVEETRFVNLNEFGVPPVEEIEVVLEDSNAIVDATVEVDLNDDLEIETTVVTEEVQDVYVERLVGVPYTVEALIGKVNGRPLYANSVLEEIADKIQAYIKREKPTQTEFMDFVFVTLYEEVLNLVKKDLLLSEANSGITPELAYGLFAVIGQMRKDLASTQGGSRSQMRRLTEEQEDVSVDSFLESNKEQILIEKLYNEKIWPNVNVTWRDIQRVFEKIHIEGFDSNLQVEELRIREVASNLKTLPLEAIPAASGSIVLGRIKLDIGDPKIEEATEMFASGHSFLEVAVAVGAENDGVWQAYELKEGGVKNSVTSEIIAEGLLSSIEEDSLFARVTGKTHSWFAILEFNEPISLYNRDIQIAVRNQLRSEQFFAEENRYLQTIWSKNGMLEVKEMAARVANIAFQRYFP